MANESFNAIVSKKPLPTFKQNSKTMKYILFASLLFVTSGLSAQISLKKLKNAIIKILSLTIKVDLKGTIITISG
jgi:hypothetical protein